MDEGRTLYTNLYLEAVQYKEDYLNKFLSKKKFSTLLNELSNEVIKNYDNEVLERSNCNELIRLINSCKALLKKG